MPLEQRQAVLELALRGGRRPLAPGTKSMSRIRSKYGSTAFRRSGEFDALSV